MSFKMFCLFNLSKDKFFTFNLNYLCLVGLWSYDHWSKKQSVLYNIYEVSGHVIEIYLLIITGFGIYQCKDDITKLFTNLDKTLVLYNFVLKVLVFVVNRKPMRILISEIEHSGDEITEARKKLMCYHVVFISMSALAVLSVFCGLAIFEGDTVVAAWVPFDYSTNMMSLLLANQILAFVVSVPLFKAFAMQGIVCSLIMYICDQLVELQERLRRLNYDPENENTMREEFKKIVDKHVRLIRYSKSMNMIFKEYFLIQNLAVTLELCLNATMVTVVGFGQKTLLANFIAFLCLALMNAYIYCYLGNEIIIQSVGIAQAAYESKWTSWPVDLQKDLLKLIQAAQKPLYLNAGGIACMSIETFCQALCNGYSIFAVLNDVVE